MQIEVKNEKMMVSELRGGDFDFMRSNFDGSDDVGKVSKTIDHLEAHGKLGVDKVVFGRLGDGSGGTS